MLKEWGAWVVQSVERPTSAQLMISWFVSWRPASSSVLTAQSLEPASDSVFPSLSLCTFPAHVLSLSISKINKYLKIKKKLKSGKRILSFIDVLFVVITSEIY